MNKKGLCDIDSPADKFARICVGCGIFVVLVIVISACLAVSVFSGPPSPPHPAGYDALMSAIDRKDPIEVEALLKKGINPNTYPNSDAAKAAEEDLAPINTAAFDGTAEIVRILLDHGANIDQEDGWNVSPLVAATQGQKLDTMTLLIQRGAKVNDSPDGSNALWRAAMDEHSKAVAFLLDHGANPDTKMPMGDHDDYLLDMVRQQNGRSDIIEMLRKRSKRK